MKDFKTMPHFTIEGTMPSLNEYLAQIGRKPQIGGRLKHQYTDIAGWAIRKGLRNYQAQKPIIIHYAFYEPNMKRDHDNVFCFASKCIQDALQKCKVIKNDGWNDVLNFTHTFVLDRKNPRIEVYIEEVENATNEV